MVGSALLYLPVYFLIFGGSILQSSAVDIATQAIYQGLLTGGLAVFAFTKSTEYLGASAGAARTAFIPIITLIMGALVLDEPLSGTKIIASGLVGFGVFLALFSQREAPDNPTPKYSSISAKVEA